MARKNPPSNGVRWVARIIVGACAAYFAPRFLKGAAPVVAAVGGTVVVTVAHEVFDLPVAKAISEII